MSTTISRRTFLGIGASAAVVAGAGLAGCTPTAKSDSGVQEGSPAEQAVSPFDAPEVPADVKETKDCDVLVIGLGLSGCAALKAAAEMGARVIGVEKQDQFRVIDKAGDFGVVGSQIQKDLGIEWAPKEDIVNQLMKDMCYRPNPEFFNYWYDHSGEDFDWFIEGADYEVIDSIVANKKTDKDNYIRPKCFPPLEGYDYRNEYYPYFHGTITANPNMTWACKAAFDAAVAAGAETLYSTWGEQLIKEDDAVVGAYLRDIDGNHIRVNANAVILACGDFAGNPDMRERYIPWAREFGCPYSNMDADGTVANYGQGQLMGMWAGGHMELGPHAPMTHHKGGVMGIDSYLQLNMQGKRFMNEDIPGQNIADQLSRQPLAASEEDREAGLKSWQIFDSKWPEQIGVMPEGHAYVNRLVSDEDLPSYTTVVDSGWPLVTLNLTTPNTIEEGVDLKADTIEELAAGMNLPVDVVVSEISRYNELCHKGHDDDFGKVATRMFPVENPPFYAIKFAAAKMLVCMGGLSCDLDLRVLDENDVPIDGLFVAGNSMGGRFLVEYPVTVAGISLATALCFGRLAGTNAAKGVS